MSEEIPKITIRGNASMAEAIVLIVATFGFMVPWVMGVVLAEGWLKVIAVPFFPYAWYLTCERFMQMLGILPQACL